MACTASANSETRTISARRAAISLLTLSSDLAESRVVMKNVWKESQVEFHKEPAVIYLYITQSARIVNKKT